MNKSVNVIVDKKSEKPISKILTKNKNVKLAFDKTIPKLRQNPTLGQQVPKSQILHEIIKEFHVTNLYRYDLIRKHHGWRLLYTLTPDDKVKILVVILKVLYHHQYDRLFWY